MTHSDEVITTPHARGGHKATAGGRSGVARGRKRAPLRFKHFRPQTRPLGAFRAPRAAAPPARTETSPPRRLERLVAATVVARTPRRPLAPAAVAAHSRSRAALLTSTSPSGILGSRRGPRAPSATPDLYTCHDRSEGWSPAGAGGARASREVVRPFHTFLPVAIEARDPKKTLCAVASAVQTVARHHCACGPHLGCLSNPESGGVQLSGRVTFPAHPLRVDPRPVTFLPVAHSLTSRAARSPRRLGRRAPGRRSLPGHAFACGARARGACRRARVRRGGVASGSWLSVGARVCRRRSGAHSRGSAPCQPSQEPFADRCGVCTAGEQRRACGERARRRGGGSHAPLSWSRVLALRGRLRRATPRAAHDSTPRRRVGRYEWNAHGGARGPCVRGAYIAVVPPRKAYIRKRADFFFSSAVWSVRRALKRALPALSRRCVGWHDADAQGVGGGWR